MIKIPIIGEVIPDKKLGNKVKWYKKFQYIEIAKEKLEQLKQGKLL